jgi:hypothetical protein
MKRLNHHYKHLAVRYSLIFLFLLVPQFQVNAAVLIKDKQWKQGSTLNILFLDGDSRLFDLVETISSQWVQNTTLKFNFYRDLTKAPKNTHIRISFLRYGGSSLGDHKDYSSMFPTMNLADLRSSDISDSGIERLVLHEFGHALGLEHEFRSFHWPYGKVPIQSIIVNCYPKMEAIGYSKNGAHQHCREINKTIEKRVSRTTAYDELSVMNYPMPFKLPSGANKTIKPTSRLSFLDRYAIHNWYGN